MFPLAIRLDIDVVGAIQAAICRLAVPGDRVDSIAGIWLSARLAFASQQDAVVFLDRLATISWNVQMRIYRVFKLYLGFVCPTSLRP
jgi:hypothetical protein